MFAQVWQANTSTWVTLLYLLGMASTAEGDEENAQDADAQPPINQADFDLPEDIDMMFGLHNDTGLPARVEHDENAFLEAAPGSESAGPFPRLGTIAGCDVVKCYRWFQTFATKLAVSYTHLTLPTKA